MYKKFILISFILINSFSFSKSIEYVNEKIIVKIEKNYSFDDINNQLMQISFNLDKKLSNHLNIWLVSYDLSSYLNIDDAIQKLEFFPYIIYAQKDHKITERLIPNDTEFENMWHLHNTGQNAGSIDADIDAPEAWDILTGNSDDDIVIGIVDSGFDLTHQDLVDNIWVNLNEIPGNGIDDDENGYIDDVNGWDAYENDGDIPLTSHGTKVLGMIGAKGNNNLDVVGVNWDISLMPIAGSSSSTSTVISAYSYALDNKLLWNDTDGVLGANVVAINSSFGINYANCNDGSYPVWNDMYNTLGEAGILSIAATMNINANVDEFGDVPTGCSSDYIISVTNTDRNDAKFISAAYGLTSIDLGAPGTSVCSTRPNNLISCSLTGTSYSTPIVSGTVGMVHAAASNILKGEYINNPSETSIIIKNIILNTVDYVSSMDTITVSGGRLNLYNAVYAASLYDGLCSIPGDFNSDTNINIQDVILIVNCILSYCTIDDNSCMDLNQDIGIDIFDIVLLVSMII